MTKPASSIVASLRVGELEQLTWGDVDEHDGTVPDLRRQNKDTAPEVSRPAAVKTVD